MTLTRFPNGISSMGVTLPQAGNMFGNYWFVKASGGSNTNSGKEPNKGFATIAKAIAVGAIGDNIILGPGTHSVDVSDSALIPKADMQFIASMPPLGGKPSTIITADADDAATLVDLDVDGVGWFGIEFLLVAGGTTAVDLFDVAQTTAVNGLVFRDCWFNLNSVDHATEIMRALALDDATNAITGMVIQNCRFLGGDATTTEAQYIVVGIGGIPNALIECNVFMLQSADGDAEGIHFNDPTTAKASYGVTVRNNDFIGPLDGGGDAVGIVIAGGSEDEIVGTFRTNYFSNCTAAITVDLINNSIIRNYEGDDATGGTLVDPGT